MLIDSGANVNTPPRKSDGFTPFTLAVSKCDTADSDDARDILQLLIEANAVPEGGEFLSVFLSVFLSFCLSTNTFALCKRDVD